MMWGYAGYASGSGLGCLSRFGLAAPVMMLFGLIVVAGIVLVVTQLTRRPATAPMQGYPAVSSAEYEIARQRLARGEITKEQFDEIWRTLRG